MSHTGRPSPHLEHQLASDVTRLAQSRGFDGFGQFIECGLGRTNDPGLVKRGNTIENYVAEGPYQTEEWPFIAAFVPPPGYHPRDDATYFPMPWLLSTRGYGFLLGAVGVVAGTALGLVITANINEIEAAISAMTGRSVFPKDVYYFKEIPTDIQPMTVLLVNLGAIGIAVVFSVLPALRAALLHPVRALRYE